MTDNLLSITSNHKKNGDSLLPFLDKIICGDCIDELKKIPDRSIDLILLDPPYWKVVSEHWDFEWRTKNDYALWCREWFKELSRIVKPSGSLYLFGYIRNMMYLFQDILALNFSFRQDIVIDKGLQALGGRATKGYKMFPNVTEHLWFFIYDSKPLIKEFLLHRQKELGLKAYEINEKLGVKANGGGVWSLYTGNNILAQVPTEEMWMRLGEVLKFDIPYSFIGQTFNIEMGITDVWTDISFTNEKRFHPTQKPIKLIERIIYASTKPGMVVLDPFLGSGTTALASKKLGRKFIGIEKEEKFCKIAETRLKNVQIELF